MEFNKQLIDDEKGTVKQIFLLRFPPIILGLFLGFLISFATSRFEKVLEANVNVAFFIPFIVYMSDAVGTQTEAIYVRHLKSGKSHFGKWLFKEALIGSLIGIVVGLVSFFAVNLWFASVNLALSVSISMFLATASAPSIALSVTYLLKKEKWDPAAGGGPISTVIQDMLSVVIYGLITSYFLL